MTINEEVTNKVSTLPQGMAWKQIQRKEKAYLINRRSFCANTEGINALKAAFDKARQTGEPLNLKIGRFDAVYKNGDIKLK